MHDDTNVPDAHTGWARSELILGGQKSGKSRRAAALARRSMAASGEHRAALLATATASDAEMSERIQRHPQDRALHCPGLQCVEVPLGLVGNEIRLGVMPRGPAVRVFVDALGQLNQTVAQAWERVSFMAAGLPMRVKGD